MGTSGVNPVNYNPEQITSNSGKEGYKATLNDIKEGSFFKVK